MSVGRKGSSGASGALAAMLGARMAPLPEAPQEIARSSIVTDNGKPLWARDTSKPIDTVPIPPELPIGWPPKEPPEILEDDIPQVSLPTPSLSLSNLFGGASENNQLKEMQMPILPTVKMKTIHWDTVMLPNTEGTLWDTISQEDPERVDDYVKV